MNEKVANRKQFPQSVVVTSGKGGTGKSIICASLAFTLAKCGFRVLLVDLDLETCGLSYYVMGEQTYSIDYGTVDIAQILVNSVDDVQSIAPLTNHAVPISLPGVNLPGQVSLLPGISRLRTRRNPQISSQLTQFHIGIMVEQIIRDALEPSRFDVVLFDTGGGVNILTTIPSNVVETFIVITEADKTSWDITEILLDAIDATDTGAIERPGNNKKNSETIITWRGPRPAGFIVNKNVLDPRPIEDFLRRRFRMMPLTTVPLDRAAVECFQTDKIPVIVRPDADFSVCIYKIVSNVFNPSSWPTDSILLFRSLRQLLKRKIEYVEYKDKVETRGRVARNLIRVSAMAIGALAILYLWMSVSTGGIEYKYATVSTFAIVLLELLIASSKELFAPLLNLRYRRRQRPSSRGEGENLRQ